jgi:hypothetical protein
VASALLPREATLDEIMCGKADFFKEKKRIRKKLGT